MVNLVNIACISKELDREQLVKVGDAVSIPGYPNGGVPQGTLSGPKHFLVHINDLQTPCPIYKYVDNSTIFEICNQDMVSVIQDSADVVEQWSRNNDMRINTTKTKEMVICFRRDNTFVDSLPHIYMNGNYIERVSQAKVLGVTISSSIQFNSIQFNSIQFNSIQFNSIQFNSIQFNSIQFNSIQFNSIQFNSIQFNSIQFNSIQFISKHTTLKSKQYKYK